MSAFLEPREFGGSEFISWAALTLTADALEAASWRFGNRADEGAACRGDIPVRPAAIIIPGPAPDRGNIGTGRGSTSTDRRSSSLHTLLSRLHSAECALQ